MLEEWKDGNIEVLEGWSFQVRYLSGISTCICLTSVQSFHLSEISS